MTTTPVVERDRWLSKGIVALAALIALILVALVGVLVKSYLFDSSSNEAQERAIQTLRGQIRENPDDPALRVSLADYYLKQQDWQNALTQAQEALRIDDTYLGGLFDQGMAYRGMRNYEAAVASFERMIELTKDNPNMQVDSRMAGVHYYLGDVYLRMGDAQKALEHGQAAWVINKTDADSIFLIGKAEAALGDDEAALDALETAVAFDPEYTEVYVAMEDVARRLGNEHKVAYAAGMKDIFGGDVASGVKKLEQATSETWDDQTALSHALWGLGYGYEQLGRHDDAIAALSRSIEADPTNIVAQQFKKQLEQR